MKKIKYPAGVVDREAYKRYLAYSKASILQHKNRYQTASDGREIDLGKFPPTFRQSLEGLPQPEIDHWLDRKHDWQVTMNRMLRSRSVAFGRVRKGLKKYEEEEKAKGITPERLYRDDVIELLGRLFSVKEVIKIMAEDNGIAITQPQVTKILRDNLSIIEQKRDQFRNRIADVRLYNKRPRLEELAWMYSKMKLRYVQLGGERAYDAMLRTLEQIRKESEGDVINLNGNLNMDINVQINNHIQQEIIKTINLKDIILGRVAARMNVDPQVLVAGLHNSYYAKFVPISGDFDKDATMEYPSLINYNFQEIQHANQGQEVVTTPTPLKPEDEAQATSAKDIIMRKIRSKRTELERNMSTYADETKSVWEQSDDPSFQSREEYGKAVGQGHPPLQHNKANDEEELEPDEE